MILSAQSIRARIGMIEPFFERSVFHGMSYGLSSAGYDIRIRESVTMKPGGFQLTSSLEHFIMPTDIIGKVCDKSTLARRGLSIFNTVIEPGWRGYLTLELSHLGTEDIFLPKGTPIAQVLFNLLDAHSEQPYSGKYQDQIGAPVGAKKEIRT